MPNRIIKESLWSSESLCRCSIAAQGFFARLFPLPDDHGCFDARPAILRSRLFPLNYNQVPEKQIETWLQELMAVDCIRVWTDAGVRYGFIPSWGKHQQIRSLHHRKTPAPPAEITAETGVENKGDSNCKQVVAVAACNPIPIPDPIPNPHTPPAGAEPESEYPPEFLEYFWNPFPKKTEKLEAAKVWKKLKPSQAKREKIRAAVLAARQSPDWLKENGRYIPNPAKWLRRGQWDDETKGPPLKRPQGLVF
jgi:hypothetical protein